MPDGVKEVQVWLTDRGVCVTETVRDGEAWGDTEGVQVVVLETVQVPEALLEGVGEPLALRDRDAVAEGDAGESVADVRVGERLWVPLRVDVGRREAVGVAEERVRVRQEAEAVGEWVAVSEAERVPEGEGDGEGVSERDQALGVVVRVAVRLWERLGLAEREAEDREPVKLDVGVRVLVGDRERVPESEAVPEPGTDADAVSVPEPEGDAVVADRVPHEQVAEWVGVAEVVQVDSEGVGDSDAERVGLREVDAEGLRDCETVAVRERERVLVGVAERRSEAVGVGPVQLGLWLAEGVTVGEREPEGVAVEVTGAEAVAVGAVAEAVAVAVRPVRDSDEREGVSVPDGAVGVGVGLVNVREGDRERLPEEVAVGDGARVTDCVGELVTVEREGDRVMVREAGEGVGEGVADAVEGVRPESVAVKVRVSVRDAVEGVREREAVVWETVSVGLRLDEREGVADRVRVRVGTAVPVPVRVCPAEGEHVGVRLREALVLRLRLGGERLAEGLAVREHVVAVRDCDRLRVAMAESDGLALRVREAVRVTVGGWVGEPDAEAERLAVGLQVPVLERLTGRVNEHVGELLGVPVRVIVADRVRVVEAAEAVHEGLERVGLRLVESVSEGEALSDAAGVRVRVWLQERLGECEGVHEALWVTVGA